ncbi:hypothetical protein [Vagococcus intermedius]|uniref:Uncharacterized protein n=1 Tax=Vagococcus intermedius TaxID=2991418 RepID=A0AAF0CUH5_9ENTE|nr:hypothetical protein [Vagococcus intermedius]WEG73107.1 hypothetical protein OL234_09080 [Vagococcus intermedius]WEG75191.1 hypothetical protein OL235_09075 [Vagococcus intermedius]
MSVEIVNLANHHSLQKEAAKWLSSKREIDEAIYLESITEEGVIPNWFLAVEGDKIIAGASVIENDFHNRPDLTPNICVLYSYMLRKLIEVKGFQRSYLMRLKYT